VVAAVIKYADNILKSFATAVSILTSTIVSAFFGFIISKLFGVGCSLVFIAIGLYSGKDPGAGVRSSLDSSPKESISHQSSSPEALEIGTVTDVSKKSSLVPEQVELSSVANCQ